MKKPIVPLLLEHKYEANGWLGALARMLLYVDVSTDEKIEENFPQVLKQVLVSMRGEPEIIGKDRYIGVDFCIQLILSRLVPNLDF